MNQSQEMHTKAIARKMKEHAESIVRRMSALEDADLSSVPRYVVQGNFTDVIVRCQQMQCIYEEMWPQMPVEVIEAEL